MSTERVDVVILGGGHNALTAAAYLARAGKSVRLLERLPLVGGAAVSERPFEGVDARLSRYSYLVSLLPQQIIDDLGLRIRLERRRYSSYTPEPGTDAGLLVDTADASATAASFARIGARADAAAWGAFYDDTATLARALFPSVTEPLRRRAEVRAQLGERLFAEFVENPIGAAIEQRFASDLVRGVVLTDALIGTFAPADDPTEAASRCFLYHVIGGGTGDWDVPVGGMGAVTGELARAAREAGAVLETGAEVLAVDGDGLVTYAAGDEVRRVAASVVLSGVAPAVLARLTGGAAEKPEGAQVKVNLLLDRLPRLRDTTVNPEAAFGGTFHINETYSQLDAAYRRAASGAVPDPVPCEIYCHSLSDPSILSPELRARGAQTLTVFGLHTPSRLTATRDELEAAVLASLDSVLAEPIRDVVATDAAGRPCIETRTTADLEASLAMPGGHIFHGPLSWPFATDDARLNSPAERWGVATEHERILICGSGAQRGGAVSGIGGHNAAKAALELLG
jgi:phytoene dehydrogenase-like protein